MATGCGEKLVLFENHFKEMVTFDLDHDVQPKETLNTAKEFLELYDKSVKYIKTTKNLDAIHIKHKHIKQLEEIQKKLDAEMKTFPDPWKADLPVYYGQFKTEWDHCVWSAEDINEALIDVLQEYDIPITEEVELQILSLL